MIITKLDPDLAQITKQNKLQVGELLSYRREVMGYKQKDVADRLGCSPATISLLENGECDDYRIFFLQAIAGILEIDVFIILLILLNQLNRKQIKQLYRMLEQLEQLHHPRNQ